MFGRNGLFYTEFGLRSDPAQASEDLEFPQGLAVTAAGQVWVADSGDNRIAEFGPMGPHASAPKGGLPVLLIGGLAVLAALLARIGLAWLYTRRRKRPAAPDAGPAAPDAGPVPPDAGPVPPDAGPVPPDAGPVHAEFSRRRVLAGATVLSGVAVGGTVLPLSLRRELAATLSDPPAGTLADIEHIVILMQENRSFDHYFGTMPGVRGFADPAAIRLPDGRPVFYQPRQAHEGPGYLTPFHYDTRTTSAQATPGTDHSWPTQHQAWNNGAMDQWVAAKGPYTMGYFTQADIPFHRALAQAFTICDNYHCSVLGPTNPNRLYMWTGMIDPNGSSGGPVIDNSPAYNNVILSWTTYPERLERAGISWQVYQEEDNFDDNALAWFRQFARAPGSSPLRQRGLQTRAAGWFENDARAREPAPGVLAGRSHRAVRASGLLPGRGRRVHREQARGDRLESRPMAEHPVHPVLRRERRAVRPRAAPHGAARHARRVRRRRADRARLPGPRPGHLALVGGRPRLLRRAGSHLAHPRHREAVRRRRTEHQRLQAAHLRRLHRRAQVLRPARRVSRAPTGPSAWRWPEAGLLTAQQEVFSNPPPLIPVVNEPVPVQ